MEGGRVSGAEQALVLREIGRGHVYGRMLYEVVLNGQVMAKICATPQDAKIMADALAKR